MIYRTLPLFITAPTKNQQRQHTAMMIDALDFLMVAGPKYSDVRVAFPVLNYCEEQALCNIIRSKSFEFDND